MTDDLVQKELETLMPLEFYEATPEEFEKYRLQALAEVEGLCGGEEAIAAANFGRVDAKGEKVSGFADGLAPYGLAGLVRKGAALRGRPIEVASWDRSAVRVEVAKPDPMTTLRIEPLDGGAVIQLAGPSTADDPWSLAVIALLDPSPTSARVR